MNSSRAKGLTRVAVGVGGLTIALLVGVLVGRATVRQLAPTAPTADTGVYFEAVQGEIERSERVTVNFAPEQLAMVTASLPLGTVTDTIRTANDSIDPLGVRAVGFHYGRVDNLIVRVEPGVVPMFRDIGLEAIGSDVVQLQSFLHREGYLAEESDGHFGGATLEAVKRWQEETGQPVTGRVAAGQFIFVDAGFVTTPEPPLLGETNPTAEVALVGDRITPTIEFGGSSTSEVQVGQKVILDLGDTMVSLEVVRVDTSDGAETVALLETIDTEQFAAIGETSTVGQLVIVDRSEGVLVPPAVLQTDATRTYVVDESGVQHDVEVVEQDGGVVVVVGIAPGTRLRLGT